ncbi:MAG TPA: hypothetical protein VM010_02980 [Chitinophagaceae bacterium]|nr:hypothetical protein [Chitinophagaceae bacterium]
MGFLKRVTVVLLVFGATACARKTISAPTNTGNNKLADSWQWLRTDGGLAFHIHNTPLSTGNAVVLKINSDSTYAFYTNNALTEKGTYTLQWHKCIHDGTEKNKLVFSSGNALMIEKMAGDTLTLSDEHHDGLSSQYLRAAAIK